MWQSDEKEEFQIDQELVKNYFNVKQDLVFDDNSARIEEESLKPFIKISKDGSVLDLGSGNGRWAKILAPNCKEYIGVDFSEKFVKYAKKTNKFDNCDFICMPAHEYMSDKKFDLIMIIGLITYMNDHDVKKMAINCKKMLKKRGKIILRNVVLKDEDRRVFNHQPNLLKRLFRRPGYQIIRRSIKKELELFNNLKLIHDQDIKGTGYHFYVFE